MCPIRIFVQSKISKIKIERFHVDQWSGIDDQCDLRDFNKNPEVTQYFKDLQEPFLEITDFKIGSEAVTSANAQSLGRMAFEPVFEGKWSVLALPG